MPVPSFLHLHPALLVLVAILGLIPMLVWRVRETRSPVSTRKIVAPPLGMSTGFLMFLAPAARVPWTYASAAFAVGALVLSIPLARTSTLVRDGDVVLMRRSKAFLWILLGLFVVRWVLRAYVERVLTPMQTGGIFFILAFGMIVRWRAAMLVAYLRLRAAPATVPVR